MEDIPQLAAEYKKMYLDIGTDAWVHMCTHKSILNYCLISLP